MGAGFLFLLQPVRHSALDLLGFWIGHSEARYFT